MPHLSRRSKFPWTVDTCSQRTLFSVLLLLWFAYPVLAQQADSSYQLPDYSGVWVRTVNTRVFLVLQLKLSGGKIEGTLTRPRHYSDVVGEGSTVTDPEALVLPVQNGTLFKGQLHFTTPDPSGKSKPDESTMILWSLKDASLAYGNFDFMPRWLLSKDTMSETPVLSTDWPSQKEQTFSPKIQAIQQELHSMVQKDQAADAPPYTQVRAAQFKEICNENYPIVADLFKKYGWLKRSEFGKQAASDFWLLSAHQADAHPQFAQEELSAMHEAVAEGEATAATYALFYDSVARTQGRSQHWGTKTVCEGGQRRLYRVDDMQGLDRRRDEALLPPEASYITGLGPCPNE